MHKAYQMMGQCTKILGICHLSTPEPAQKTLLFFFHTVLKVWELN
uniref:Uncharacterized protein n=1 Tax=Zea mays TaxID=4577 RepID=C0PBC2_MAIZE|nr:unknown [Zea mays]